MKIHKEGRSIIAYTFVIYALINTALFFLAGKNLLSYFILTVSIVFFLIVLNFFRSPRRVFHEAQENTVLAPADGTIVVVEEVTENEYFHEKKIQVSIFMSVFNVHVNWIPTDGTVIHSSHQDGRFCAAYLPKSSAENERSTVIIRKKNGEEILVRQIAGAMARRIVTYAEADRECRINEQLGFIKFGSRVDLFLPIGTKINVQMDEKVRGNQTVIAQLT
jgi:phosphatidylserine decarboxylase